MPKREQEPVDPANEAPNTVPDDPDDLSGVLPDRTSAVMHEPVLPEPERDEAEVAD